MADFVTRAGAAIVLCAVVIGGNACAASEPVAKTPLESVRIAAAAAEAIFHILDEAAAEAYVLHTLANGAGPINGTQACTMPDNRTSRRPSALANPPYAEASIHQRGRLIRVLGAYAVLEGAVTHAASITDAGAELANFQAAAFDLNMAANVHAQGDLFIDEGAAALVSIAGRLRSDGTVASMQSTVAESTRTIAKLARIVQDDVTRRQLEAQYATQLDVNIILAPAQRSTPFCNEPIVPASAVPISATDGAPLPKLLHDAYEADIARRNALGAFSLAAFFEALLAINEAAPHDGTKVEAGLRDLGAATFEPEKHLLDLL